MTDSGNKADRKHGRRFQSEPPLLDEVFSSIGSARTLKRGAGFTSARMLGRDHDESEANIVTILEGRRRPSREWHAAVEGELPPMSRIPSRRNVFDNDTEPVSERNPRLFSLVQRMRAKTQLISSVQEMLEEPSETDQNGHVDVFASNQDDAPTTHTENLIDGARRVNDLFEEDEKTEPLDDESTVYSASDQGLPLLQEAVSSGSGYGTASQQRRKKKKKKKKKRHTIQSFFFARKGSALAEVLNPEACMKNLRYLCVGSSLTFVVVPCLLAAALLYYVLGNPEIDFMPGDATLSWWLLFAARQAVLLELSFIIEFVVVEALALRTKWVVNATGPLVTLGLIQAKGWPFVAIIWSLLDICLLHGNNTFQQNWLYFLDVGLFSSANPGGDFLYSDFYTRALLAVLLAGLAHAIKRTTVALYFGKSTLLTYKSRLEKILSEIVMITEAAELVAELELLESNTADAPSPRNPMLKHKSTRNKWKDTLDVQYKGFGDHNPESCRSTSDVEDVGDSLDDDLDEDDIDDEELDDDDDEEEDGDDDDYYADSAEDEGGDDPLQRTSFTKNSASSDKIQSSRRRKTGSVASGWSSTSTAKIKRLLERWEEPRNKRDERGGDASIGDILRFRKALTYMDGELPFGKSFGSASTRDECIKSASRTYRRLLRVTDRGVLSFEVIRLLAITKEGVLDEAKELALTRLFRPDIENELPLLAFVQSCDTVYKKLRFFRASVANSSVINQVLESIVDKVVNFLLLLIIMSLLQYDPYPILVSLSTLMVSFAFAVGSSASRYIEGVLLIAVRRPYDIGDRIVLEEAHVENSNGLAVSWFVEDINIWSTTIRYATSNEVATVNNGSIPNLRIVNCNRSPNALISIDLKFDLRKILGNDKLELFRAEIEGYISDRPRIYEGFVHLRCCSTDTNNFSATFQLRVRHRRSWQDAPVILTSRSELIWRCTELRETLGICYVADYLGVQVMSEEAERRLLEEDNNPLPTTDQQPEPQPGPHSESHSEPHSEPHSGSQSTYSKSTLKNLASVLGRAKN